MISEYSALMMVALTSDHYTKPVTSTSKLEVVNGIVTWPLEVAHLAKRLDVHANLSKRMEED